VLHAAAALRRVTRGHKVSKEQSAKDGETRRRVLALKLVKG